MLILFIFSSLLFIKLFVLIIVQKVWGHNLVELSRDGDDFGGATITGGQLALPGHTHDLVSEAACVPVFMFI